MNDLAHRSPTRNRVVVYAKDVWIVLRRADPATLDHALGLVRRIAALYEVQCHRFPLERDYYSSIDEAVGVILERA